MSLSQISFTAFAQSSVCPPPPAPANGSVRSLAAPAEPGVGVDTPPRFDGAFRPRSGLSCFTAAGGWEGDWFIDWQAHGAMDAPEWLPGGSHRSMTTGAGTAWCAVMADGYGAPSRSSGARC
jgi:hypothetical protein